MIAFVETAPQIDEQRGHFIMTFDSGGEPIKIMMTRHALFVMARRALGMGKDAFAGDAEIIGMRKADRE